MLFIFWLDAVLSLEENFIFLFVKFQVLTFHAYLKPLFKLEIKVMDRRDVNIIHFERGQYDTERQMTTLDR